MGKKRKKIRKYIDCKNGTRHLGVFDKETGKLIQWIKQKQPNGLSVGSTKIQQEKIAGPEEKLCKRCDTVKALDDFSENPKRKDGRSLICQSCHLEIEERRAEKKSSKKDNREKKPKEISYLRDYLNQPLWTEVIRPRILARDSFKCQICESTDCLQVHHRSYSREVMRGDDDSKLITLCRKHHLEIEFTKYYGKKNERNRKRSKKEVEQKLLELLGRKRQTQKAHKPKKWVYIAKLVSDNRGCPHHPHTVEEVKAMLQKHGFLGNDERATDHAKRTHMFRIVSGKPRWNLPRFYDFLKKHRKGRDQWYNKHISVDEKEGLGGKNDPRSDREVEEIG